MWNMQEFDIQFELTMAGQSRTTTSRRKELCTWNCVCVVKCSWRMKLSCWTVRRPTAMTTWKPRSTQSTWNPTMTWHTWWTSECARVVVGVRSLVLSQSLLAHIARLKMSECLSHLIHAWSERFFWLLWSLHHLHLPSLLINLKQFLLPLSPRGQVVTHCALRKREMVSTDESFSNTVCPQRGVYRSQEIETRSFREETVKHDRTEKPVVCRDENHEHPTVERRWDRLPNTWIATFCCETSWELSCSWIGHEDREPPSPIISWTRSTTKQSQQPV